MTVLGLLRTLGRRWYILVAGMLLTAVAFAMMHQAGGVYTARTQVMFVAPGEQPVGTSNDALRDSLVAFTASIERIVNDGQPIERLASSSAMLNGAGVAKGYTVQMPNSGGQWQTSFSQPALDIQVVGPNATWVHTTLSRLIDRIDAVTRDQQRNVAVANTITANSAADRVPVSYVGSSRSTQLRALIALTVLGLALSCAASIVIDRHASKRRIGTPTPHASTSHRTHPGRAQPHPAGIAWGPQRPMNRPQGENAP